MTETDDGSRDISLAADEQMVRRCFDLMRQLRPRLASEAEFVDRWKRQRASGYKLAVYTTSDQVVALAGFYVRESLVHGAHLCVDDLIVEADARSQRFGSRMIEYLKVTASAAGCGKILLDTPMTNTLGQRFYLREHFAITAFRLSLDLKTPNEQTSE